MTIDTACYIEIPSTKLRDAVKLAYDFSSPQGLGFLHFKEGTLSETEISGIIDSPSFGGCIVRMDYVNGRACKFNVFRHEERIFVKPYWFDHGDWQLEELLESLGVECPKDKMLAAQEAQRLANEKWDRENP